MKLVVCLSLPTLSVMVLASVLMVMVLASAMVMVLASIVMEGGRNMTTLYRISFRGNGHMVL
jgi:hypothetical protein